MEIFEFCLPDGGTISGRFNFPKPQTSSHLPLIVCIHGGSYDAEYFDVDEDHSILSISVSAKIPVISLTRPGYGSSSPVPTDDRDEDTTYGQAQGKYLNSIVLPFLWEQFKERSGATGIVIMSHSIGAMISIIIAGSHTGTEGYPLSGLITSGISTELGPGPRGAMLHLLNETTGVVQFDETPKDAIMLQIPMNQFTDPQMCRHTKRLNWPLPPGELHDINMTWLDYWRKYSDRVTVPVMHALAEFDGLWTYSPEALEDYKNAFPNSPHVTSEVVPMAPHCIELSLQSKPWYMKCCSFALQCAIWDALRPTLPPPTVPVIVQKTEEEIDSENEIAPPQGGITTLVYTTTRYEAKGP
ncbi:hypothetical protein N7517_003930 [Penicillium concentricum]|uniref:AB hydrolase-1 domain-containing protein n=1 Tax=Penicillium concentricum TaxID=293559 RepID=A0A9W9S6M9_9EURO|nr:uncharacterized protein N7517_003930 [Penicillium concentricum]KAJ5371924.1 hypothetical protein N7517_003930 [Penicillium concentricum]